MEIKLEMDNGVVILQLSGNLVASSAETLREQIAKLIEKKFRFIVLDLGKVDFIDSSGLGSCIASNRDLNALNGVLACSGLNDNVRKVFRMTRADQKIKIFAARSDAVYALLELINPTSKK